MKIEIYFETRKITTFNKLKETPFKVGDKLSLNVTDFSSKGVKQVNSIILENEELKNKFNGKIVEIIDEIKYLDFNCADEPELIIKYHIKNIK